MAQSRYAPEELFAEARRLYYEAQYSEALREIEKYLLTERDPQGFFMESMIYEAMGNSTRAISSLTNAVALDPGHLESYFKRGLLYYNKGIYNQAIQDFNMVLDFDGQASTSAIYYQLDPNGQEQVKLSTIATMRAQVYGLRGLAFQAIGEYEKALNDLNSSIERDSSAQNFVNRALLYKETNQRQLALNDLERAVRIDPDLVIGWYNLVILDPEHPVPNRILHNAEFFPMISYRAVEAYQSREYDLAESLFREALALRPNDPLLLINSGRLNYQRGDYRDAVAFFKKVLEVDPSRFEAYYLLGNSFHQIQEYTQSVSYYEQYLARDRSNGTVWYNAALTYFELDDDQRGCECLQNASQRGVEISSNSSLWNSCRQ